MLYERQHRLIFTKQADKIDEPKQQKKKRWGGLFVSFPNGSLTDYLKVANNEN